MELFSIRIRRTFQLVSTAQTKRNAQKHQHQRGNGSARRQARHRRRPQVRQQGRSRS